MKRSPDYTMVLPVRHFRIGEGRVAVESAFAEHLRMMRERLGQNANRLVVASPGMSAAAYEKVKKSWTVLDESAEQVIFLMLFSDDEARSVPAKIRLLPSVLRRLSKLSGQSFCVHSGLSWDVWLPFEFAAIVFAVFRKRRTVYVVDIDYRNSAWMSYRSGEWSKKNYLLSKYLYDVARSLQVRFAVRFCSLVLLKGKQMAADFGHGRQNVKAFLDASHSEKNLIDPESLEQKIAVARNSHQPLRLVYFGRLTGYKGIDRCIRAAAQAKTAGANVTLDIIGGGEQMDALQALARELNAGDWLMFHGPLPFNQEFFRLLYSFHLLLAAPLREDTPRSALDAMAAGIPYLAFDTYYYKELLESGAGAVVPWPEVSAMADAIVRLDTGRDEVAEMVRNAVSFAAKNTQEMWLERRMEWAMASALD